MEWGKSFMHDRKWDSCRQRLLFANIYCEKGVSACKVSFPLWSPIRPQLGYCPYQQHYHIYFKARTCGSEPPILSSVIVNLMTVSVVCRIYSRKNAWMAVKSTFFRLTMWFSGNFTHLSHSIGGPDKSEIFTHLLSAEALPLLTPLSLFLILCSDALTSA